MPRPHVGHRGAVARAERHSVRGREERRETIGREVRVRTEERGVDEKGVRTSGEVQKSPREVK